MTKNKNHLNVYCGDTVLNKLQDITEWNAMHHWKQLDDCI